MKEISVSGGSKPTQKILDLRFFFFYSLWITVVIHQLLAGLQRLPKRESLTGQLAVLIDSISAFPYFFRLSLLSEKLASF